MSEVKLNLIDAQHTLHGEIHGSVADSAVAALSAEPETIAELEAALARYIKPDAASSPFAWFRTDTEIDDRPWDAGIVVIDLAARIVAVESTYSRPRRTGRVDYHDGVSATDISLHYRVPDDWVFLDSIEEFEGLRAKRLQRRQAEPPLDARAILYGRPLLEFIVREVAQTSVCVDGVAQTSVCVDGVAQTSVCVDNPVSDSGQSDSPLNRLVAQIHIRWLMTPRDDLRGQSPRKVILQKQDFIDYDLDTRALQWSLQGEAPPCLATDSFAYRFAGFGTHERVIYYDLVRLLLWKAVEHVRRTSVGRHPDAINEWEFAEARDQNIAGQPSDKLQFVAQAEIARLEEIKSDWLENPQAEYDNRTPAILIQSERQRLPITISGRELIIDEDCPICQMMAAESELGLEVAFWHLDGSHMDDDFAFSHFRTREEWEADRRRWEAFSKKFNREWEERHSRSRQDHEADDDPF